MEKKNKPKIIIILSIIVTFAFLIFIVINMQKDSINLLITSLFVGIMSILLIFPFKKSGVSNLIAFLLIGLTAFNAYTFAKPSDVVSDNVIKNFQNGSLSDALEYFSSNNIKVVTKYDYSDYFPKYYIINQSVIGSNLSDVKELELLVSNGPSYDVQVVLPSFVGESVDALADFINTNYLSNVDINFVDDTAQPNTIISQSVSGKVKRSDKIEFSVSKAPFKDVDMINLCGKSLYDTKLWLGMNGIGYNIEYDYNDLDRGFVFKQSIDDGTKLTENDVITISVSKGKSIVVPDLTKLSRDEVMKWITDNNLNVEYKEEYNKDYDAGKVISVNYKENDIIEQGSTVIITTSKGSLKMIKYTSLSDFKLWASDNGVKYEINYSFSDSVTRGNLIKCSHTENDIITDGDTVILTISNGKAVIVPNFKGMSKADIQNKCNSLGLNCSFSYYGYTVSTNKDIGVTQTIAASRQVVSGTYIKIALSSGIAKTFVVEINETDLVINNADKTIASLKSLFSQKYPGVNFNFITRSSNTYNNSGFIHENSSVKNGTRVIQGKTYTVTITS